MQGQSETISIPQKIGWNTDFRTKKSGHKFRNSGKKKNENSSIRKSNTDFLNFQFEEIAYLDKDEFSLDFDEESSRDNLYDIIENYVTLSGNKFEFVKSDNFIYDINRLCNELDKVIDSRIYINLEFNSEQVLQLFLYSYHPVFQYQLCFLPICIVEHLPKEIADFFILFIAYYMQTQRISDAYSHMDFDWCLTEQVREYEDDEDDEWTGLIQDAQAYNEGGKYKEIIDYIDTIDVSMELIIETYNELKSDEYKDFLYLMREGIEILSKDSIMKYDYNPTLSDECLDCYQEDWEPFEMERLFAVIWKNDLVVEQVEESMNTYLRESLCHGMVQYMKLTNHSKELFSISDFPFEFEQWYLKIYEKLKNYGKNN